jgi:hypothetical protein
MREAGKGDTQRPTDHKAYSDNYDLIWGKKDDKKTNRPIGTVQEEARTDTEAPVGGTDR